MRFIEDVKGKSWFDIIEGLPGQANITLTHKGQRRGLHRHHNQDELFLVIMGSFQVIMDNPKWSGILVPGERMVVKRGRWHGFEALEDSIYFYYQNVKYDPKDQEEKEWK